MKKKIEKSKKQIEVYGSVSEAVEAIFVNKKDRKRMFLVLFLLAILGAFIIAVGTHFMIKQQEIIEQNKDIDWRNHYRTGIPLQADKDIKIDEAQAANEALVPENEIIQNSKQLKQPKEAKILFVGDLMLDRYNRELISQKNEEWMTQKVGDLFAVNDLNVANLEGPVTDNDSISIGSEEGSKENYIFTFNPESTNKFLKYNNIKLLNLGNNHILNFGRDGFSQTKDFIYQNNFESFGDIRGEAGDYLVKNINGFEITFISYNQFGGKGVEEIIKIVKEAEGKSDFVIVYTHWGVEYELEETESQRQKAHQFVDAGADLIIGSHPHVIQSVEIYKEKAIFYSLGNFIFDQYFSPDTMTGLGVKVFLQENGKIEFSLMPFELRRNGQLEFADEQEKRSLLERILKTEETKTLMSF
jgi:gamma-polyglutamate biosynthesis protein CapA